MMPAKASLTLRLAALLMTAASVDANAQMIVSGTIQYGGLQREYLLYVPAVYNPAVHVPLVFNLHGYTSSNLEQLYYGDFRPIADTANFILALPNGTLDGQGNRFWNSFGLTTVDDLGFISALIDSLSAQYSIDADRIYSTGMSNGGFMSYELACFRSERFAAIASVTGSMATPRLAACNASHPTPVMQIHGTADPTVNYNGSAGVEAIEPLVANWVEYNNCNPSPNVSAVPNVSLTDGCTAEHYVYTGGDAGSSVEFYKVIGGGHTWPGAAFTIGVTNQDFSASKEIWRFFRQYSLSTLAGVSDAASASSFSIGPNPSADAFQLRFTDARQRIISVTDAVGRLISKHQSNSGRFDLRIDAEGLYLVTVTSDGKSRTERVFKL